MTAKGHAIFAIALAIISKRAHLTPILTHGDWWHIISAAILTSLLPDIDHPRSLLGQHLKWLSASMRVIFGHRGFTHSILALATAVKLLNLILLLSRVIIPADVRHGMIIGYISHLIADSLTPAGIPLLWPLRWKLRLPIILNLHKNQYISERLFGFTLIVISLLMPSYYLISLSRHIKIIPIHILQVLLHFFQKYIN
ncbi:MAG: metal-dependent hydrolase [Candidatus Dasytiphilus stammeri]